MPYRRLPNTDTQRVKALKRAIELADKYDPDMLAFKQSTVEKIKAYMPTFEQALTMQKEARARQVTNSKEFTESLIKARIYISHFIQVMNMCIVRGELKRSARTFYGLDIDENTVPRLFSEAEVVEWGEKIIKGENDRVVKTGNPILTPKIAVVKVYYDEFIEKLNFQKMLQSITARANDKVASMRRECNVIIAKLWNEIEDYYSKETPERKREQCAKYGISYIWRPYEKAKLEDIAAAS